MMPDLGLFDDPGCDERERQSLQIPTGHINAGTAIAEPRPGRRICRMRRKCGPTIVGRLVSMRTLDPIADNYHRSSVRQSHCHRRSSLYAEQDRTMPYSKPGRASAVSRVIMLIAH
jgi:hypothetical protein